VLAAVLGGKRPDGGVVGQPIAEESRWYCPALRCPAVESLSLWRNGLLHELDDIGLGLESLTRRIVALAEVGPEI